MVIVTPVLSQTHEIYFDVSGTDLYVRRESPAGMYEPEITFNPIAEGNGSIVIHWRQNDVIRFHIPEDNFGFNYSVNISCDHLDTGWTCMYINTDTHAQGESHLAKSDDLPSNHLNSASNIVWVFANGRDGSISSSAYSVLDVTISIYRRTGTAEKD